MISIIAALVMFVMIFVSGTYLSLYILEIEAFIKSPFYVVNTKNSSYGQGVVCDGHNRLVILEDEIMSSENLKKSMYNVIYNHKRKLSTEDENMLKKLRLDEK